MTSGPFIGFCTRCRNKVRQPYSRVDGDDLRHISKVQVRLGPREYTKEVCDGLITLCSLEEAFELQRNAGFSFRKGDAYPVDRWGRRPFAEGLSL